MSTAESTIGFAEAQALKRRERILKLRKKVEGKPEDEEKENLDTQPPSDQLNDESNNDPEEPQVLEPKSISIKDSILNEELDLNQLAPRKIDWDLTRGIEREMEMLQESTNNAIAELIRDEMVDDIQV